MALVLKTRVGNHRGFESLCFRVVAVIQMRLGWQPPVVHDRLIASGEASGKGISLGKRVGVKA